MEPSKNTEQAFNKWFALFFVVVAAVFGYDTAFVLHESTTFQSIGTKVWPTILVVTLAIIAVAIFFDTPVEDDDPMKEEIATGWASWALIAALLLCVPVLMYFGFWITGSFLMATVAWLKEKRTHVVRSVIAAVVAPGAIFLLFTHVLEQYLPVGSLFE